RADSIVHPYFFLQPAGAHPALHSFPTRRSSDLLEEVNAVLPKAAFGFGHVRFTSAADDQVGAKGDLLRSDLRVHRALGNVCGERDRKSTRLNSSHVKISYAVFCLKKNSIADLYA